MSSTPVSGAMFSFYLVAASPLSNLYQSAAGVGWFFWELGKSPVGGIKKWGPSLTSVPDGTIDPFDVKLWCSLGLHLVVCSVALSLKLSVSVQAIQTAKLHTRLSIMSKSFLCHIENKGDQNSLISGSPSAWQDHGLVRMIKAQDLKKSWEHVWQSCSLVNQYVFSLLLCYLPTSPSFAISWELSPLSHPLLCLWPPFKS